MKDLFISWWDRCDSDSIANFQRDDISFYKYTRKPLSWVERTCADIWRSSVEQFHPRNDKVTNDIQKTIPPKTKKKEKKYENLLRLLYHKLHCCFLSLVFRHSHIVTFIGHPSLLPADASQIQTGKEPTNCNKEESYPSNDEHIAAYEINFSISSVISLFLWN